MEAVIYEHKVQGKTIFSLAFLIGAILLVLIGANSGAPIYWYMPVGFALLFGAWHFMSNPNHGCRLTQSEFTYWTGKNAVTLPVGDINVITQKTWMDGPDDFEISMKNGTSHALSYLAVGPSDEFATGLKLAGITITPKE